MVTGKSISPFVAAGIAVGLADGTARLVSIVNIRHSLLTLGGAGGRPAEALEAAGEVFGWSACRWPAGHLCRERIRRQFGRVPHTFERSSA